MHNNKITCVKNEIVRKLNWYSCNVITTVHLFQRFEHKFGVISSASKQTVKGNNVSRLQWIYIDTVPNNLLLLYKDILWISCLIKVCISWLPFLSFWRTLVFVASRILFLSRGKTVPSPLCCRWTYLSDQSPNLFMKNSVLKKEEKKKCTPMRGIEPRPRRWERRILTTRPHGKARMQICQQLYL